MMLVCLCVCLYVWCWCVCVQRYFHVPSSTLELVNQWHSTVLSVPSTLDLSMLHTCTLPSRKATRKRCQNRLYWLMKTSCNYTFRMLVWVKTNTSVLSIRRWPQDLVCRYPDGSMVEVSEYVLGESDHGFIINWFLETFLSHWRSCHNTTIYYYDRFTAERQQLDVCEW